MPMYDFVCGACGQRFEIFLSYNEYGSKAVACAHCGSTQVRRRMTKVRIAKSEDGRMDSMSDEFSGLDGVQDDPRAMGKMMRKMSREMGEEMPPEFDDVVDRLEAGQSPEDIESAMPDLSAGDSTDE